MELMRKDLKLIVIKGLESSEGSAHVPVGLTVDGINNYKFYTTQIHIRYIYKNKVYEEMLPMDDEGFYIPSKPLFENGPIELAVHLISGEKKFVTNEVCFVVQRAPNGSSQIGPSELSWQQLVDQYVESKLNVIMARIDNLTNSQTNLNELIDIRVGYDGTKYDTAGDSVRMQIFDLLKAQRSLKDLIDSNQKVVNERIDSFTNLGEGSTTADAELVDARIDFEGNKKKSLGASIREADKKMFNMIQEMFEMLLTNKFSTNLSIDLDNCLADENGDNVLADWAYEVK